MNAITAPRLVLLFVLFELSFSFQSIKEPIVPLLSMASSYNLGELTMLFWASAKTKVHM
jgi:hypothetical protein